MSNDQATALLTSACIGIIGALGFTCNPNKKWRIFIYLWTVFWLSGPLLAVWIKGVFG